MTRAHSNTPTVGAEVFTADGERLGTVKEVAGSCFKVDAPMQHDNWLASDCITSTSGSQVCLTVGKDQLGDAKVDGPGHIGMHTHGPADTAV
jgi:hypothetical protein